MRGRLEEIRAAGADLVFLGSGSPQMAADFRDRDVPGLTVLTDPSLETYRRLGMKRGVGATLGPRTWTAAARAVASGHMQKAPAGDAWQQGGLVVLARGGEIVYRRANRHAGDRPDLHAALRALRGEGTAHSPGRAAPVFRKKGHSDRP